jgi:predicted glycogen debranching enzyme
VPELVDAPSWIDQLVLASDSFVFARPLEGLPDGESVIAGYPWFGDWGRDTMIALPGLALATGRFDTARHILLTFASFVDQGMLPNVFPGAGDKPDYNTADAALWYIEAWRAYFETTHDRVSLKQVFPLRHRPRCRRRPAPRRRARRTDHLDGRQARRLGGHAAHR